MFFSKSKEGLSSTLAVAMFTSDNEYQMYNSRDQSHK